MGLHVKTNRYHYVGARKTMVNPGSVILIDNDDVARDFVKRGLGTLCAGPVFDAPAPARAYRDDKLIQTLEGIEEEMTRPSVEREDLASKLHKAEKMVSPAQRAGAI